MPKSFLLDVPDAQNKDDRDIGGGPVISDLPDTYHLKHYLSPAEQSHLAAECLQIGAQPAGFYTPTVKNGRKMSVRMMCLGLHWNAKLYRYETTRSDHDGLPVQPIPPEFAGLAARAASEVGMQIAPDICIVNLYAESSRLGLHQDRDERPETLAAGVPIISVSLGDDADFVIGGFHRSEPLSKLILKSGDVFVMGGRSRLRYHGVARVLPGTAPGELAIEGRINLTFRQY